MRYLMEIFYSEEDAGYIAIIPDLPGCSAWGETPEEAAQEIQDAQAAWIDACRKSGEPLPAPSYRGHRAGLALFLI